MATETSKSKLVPFVLMSLVTLIFLFWAMRQCSTTDNDGAMRAEEETRRAYLDSLAERDQRQILQRRLDSVEQAARAAALQRAYVPPGDSVAYARAPQTVTERVTVLYSTIDGLNVRTGPGLKYRKLARIPLHAEVIFAGQVTDSLYQIDLGDVTPTAPWVKIRLPDGKTGWVYGAGVSYYKTRLEGVLN